MRDNFILGMIVVCFLLALTSRIAGLYTYWWFGIFRPHDWVWGSLITSLKLPLIAALLLVLPTILQRIVPKIDSTIATLIAFFLGFLIIADVTNGCGNVLSFRTATVFSLFILFYIVLLTTELVATRKKLFWLIAIISISIAAHSAKGGLHALLSGASNYGANNLTGLFSGSNAFALGTGMLLFFMIFTFQFINSKLIHGDCNKWYNKPPLLKLYKIIFLGIIVCSFYNIVSLESRGSFLATSLGLFIWVLLHKFRIRMLIVIPFILVLGLSVAPMPEGYQERISSVFAEEEERDNSAASRPHFWEVAVKMVEANPLGVGPGCYAAYYNEFDISQGQYGLNRSVHSSHFQILAEAGYFGFLIWLLLFLVSYLKLFKIRSLAKKQVKDPDTVEFYTHISSALICTITVFIAGGAFYEYAYNDIIWLVFALIIAIERNINKEINSTSSLENKNENKPVIS
ncbi:MAG: O-antigen ligase family protein [Gammaproteobacteria bacterium]|nr:O-antigen ligase family protein [Gammaproteobacteria bacterium]